MIHNKLLLIIPAAVIFVTILTLATSTIPIFTQSDGGGANQTMEDAGRSAIQTGEGMQQGASDVGSKITEGAKDFAGSIGDKLQDLGK